MRIGELKVGESKRTGVFREPTPEAVAEARSLLAVARHGALATLAPEDGHPMVTRIGIAVLPDGMPVTLVSELAGHTPALRADPRCAVMVGEPGKGDPLAHPRLTLKCRAEAIERGSAAHGAAREVYLAAHRKARLYVDFTDFLFVRLVPEGASYVAGFGAAYRLAGADLLAG